MRKPAEITVFLSLILVSVLSLLLGLLESARTAGARLYLQMSADSAMASVMSHYNRNLWEAYDLLFLEYETEEDIEKVFEEYFQYYLEQENFYPMKKEDVTVDGIVTMIREGGKPLEEEILNQMKYRLPDVAADTEKIAGEAAQAAKAGDFAALLTVCRQAGKETRRLEKRRALVEERLEEMAELYEKVVSSAEEEKKSGFRNNGKRLSRKMEEFSREVAAYEREVERLSGHRGGLLRGEEEASPMDPEAKTNLDGELAAYGQVEEAAREALFEYQKKERILQGSRENLDFALELLEDTEEEGEENGEEDEEEAGPDWDEIRSCVEEIEIPVSEERKPVDREKEAALDRLEALFEKDLLDLVLPAGTTVSQKAKNLAGSMESSSGKEGNTEILEENPVDRLLIGEYIGLYLDSFLFLGEGGAPREEKPLSYEQEYLLCGERSDRENLEGMAERLLGLRGASNLLYLLNTPERKAEAELLAAAVSAGTAPVQFVVTFLILTLWAFGEAVFDVRTLLSGESVPLWKTADTWKTSLEGLLRLEFLEGGVNGAERPGAGGGGVQGANSYGDYLRILLFLQNREERNFRLMDVIQWNIREVQEDFSIRDCASKVMLTVKGKGSHLFLLKNEYDAAVKTVGKYD